MGADTDWTREGVEQYVRTAYKFSHPEFILTRAVWEEARERNPEIPGWDKTLDLLGDSHARQWLHEHGPT